jgi:hypothetical protein
VGVTAASRATELSPSGSPTSEPKAAVCLNCATPLTGPFCSNCGQRDVPPYPSVRELAVDAFWELSGWDGRFAATVRALFRRPGMLTREFLEGRRARYISPLRLYLMASLVYFLVAAAAPDVKTDGGKSLFLGVRVTPTAPDTTSRPGRVAAAASDAQNGKVLTAAERDTLLAQIQSAPAVMRPFLRRIVSDPAGFKSALLQAMPKMLFALLPIFALLVSAFYRRLKYPEHLYFAIHLHAFVFLALALIEIAKFSRMPIVVAIVSTPVLLWIPTYSTLAFRRVYGGSIAKTLAKEAGIGMIYSFAAGIAFMVMLTLVSLFG